MSQAGACRLTGCTNPEPQAAAVWPLAATARHQAANPCNSSAATLRPALPQCTHHLVEYRSYTPSAPRSLAPPAASQPGQTMHECNLAGQGICIHAATLVRSGPCDDHQTLTSKQQIAHTPMPPTNHDPRHPHLSPHPAPPPPGRWRAPGRARPPRPWHSGHCSRRWCGAPPTETEEGWRRGGGFARCAMQAPAPTHPAHSLPSCAPRAPRRT